MKLAVVGTGMIVQEFLGLSHLLKQYELTDLCGRKHREKEMKKLRDRYAIQRISFSYDDVLAGDSDTIYIGISNHLHYEYARLALNAKKNVILEKPLTVTATQAKELIKIAKDNKLFLFEAISNQYLPNYYKIKEILPQIGDIKIVSFNFSQYSSRYKQFKNGDVPPVFSFECAGGALMDLNVYNVHFAVGLFGKPLSTTYYPNIENKIDTSGILVMNYPSFQCVCVASKDSYSPSVNMIQADMGCIYIDTPLNSCSEFRLIKNGEKQLFYNENTYEHRMISEFQAFSDIISRKDYDYCYNMLDQTLIVVKILQEGREKVRDILMERT